MVYFFLFSTFTIPFSLRDEAKIKFLFTSIDQMSSLNRGHSSLLKSIASESSIPTTIVNVIRFPKTNNIYLKTRPRLVPTIIIFFSFNNSSFIVVIA